MLGRIRWSTQQSEPQNSQPATTDQQEPQNQTESQKIEQEFTKMTDQREQQPQPQQQQQQQQQQTKGNEEPRTNLIINYLPQSMTEKDLYSLFVTIGPVESCRVMKDYKVGSLHETIISLYIFTRIYIYHFIL